MAKAETKQAPSRGGRADPPEIENPKDPNADVSNRIKDPEEWTTGHEPMTGAQASYLKTLSEEAGDDKAYEPDLDKAEASKRIGALRKETGKDG